MSHYRNLGGGKRDDNEPQIMKRFAAHGWHCEQISGNRLWDLLAFNLRLGTHSVRLIDVKMPDGSVTQAQVDKWTALHHKGIPVYVVRTEADVDALVRGELRPWVPETSGRTVLATADAGKRLRVVRESGKGEKRAPRPAYEAPRAHRTNPMATKAVVPSAEDAAIARAVLAAQEAEATFAPGQHHDTCRCVTCGPMRIYE